MPKGGKAVDRILTPEKKGEFLSALSEYGNVTQAAAAIGVHRPLLYYERNKDGSFAEVWDEAAAIGAARLEDEARRRAVEGWLEPVHYKGERTGEVRRYSDTLLIVLLKAHHPEKYRERTDVNQHVDGDLAVRMERIEGRRASRD